MILKGLLFLWLLGLPRHEAIAPQAYAMAADAMPQASAIREVNTNGHNLSSAQPRTSVSPLQHHWLASPAVTTLLMLGSSAGWVWLLLWNRNLSRQIGRYQHMVRKLRQNRHRAWHAAHAKARFLAVMSHELRTPLSGILGMLELVNREPLAPAQKEKLQVVYDSSQSLLTIINDILEFSRLEAGKLQLERQAVAIETVVRPVFSAMAVSAQRKELVFVTEIDDALHNECYFLDPTRLRQVLFNLIGNAIKFTPQGTIQVMLTRSVRAPVDYLQIEVVDSGIGIPKDKLASLFDAFEQADVGISRTYGGSGLGLTISRELVELMEGTLTLESTPGLGTRALVQLPLKSACAYCLNTSEANCPRFPSAPGDGVDSSDDITQQWTGHRILLAEDHPVTRQVLAEQLRLIGITVDMATNGHDALTLYQKQSYSLVLADCQMPEMDGLELADRLRQLQQHHPSPVPVVAVTAHASQGARQTCLDAGFTDVVSKPISLLQLEQLLERHLTTAAANPEPAFADLSLAPAPETGSAEDPSPPSARGQEHLPPPVLDISILVDAYGSSTNLEQLCNAYLKSNGEDMEKLKDAVAQADALTVRQAAHRLKGAARMMGATAFAECCARLEASCYLGLHDMESLKPLLEELSHQHSMLLLTIESLELATENGPSTRHHIDH